MRVRDVSARKIRKQRTSARTFLDGNAPAAAAAVAVVGVGVDCEVDICTRDVRASERASVRRASVSRLLASQQKSRNASTRAARMHARTHYKHTHAHTHTHSCHHMRRSCVRACMHACVRTIIGARRMRIVRAQDSNADERAARRRLTCTSQETDSRQTDAKTSELQTDCESIDTERERERERERDERNKRSHFCKRFFKQKRVEQIYLPFITSLSLSIVVIVTMSVGGRRCSPPFFSHSFRATNNDGGVFAQ